MSKTDTARLDLETEILRPYTYIFKARSTTIIAEDMAVAMNYWLKVPQSKLEQIQKHVERAVNFTFLFDDIQDNSLMRRNIPTAHQLFGVPLTINACIHSLLLLLSNAEELGHPEARNIFTDQLLLLMIGQGACIYWKEHCTVFSEEDYKWMSQRKSSEVFMIVVKLMQLFSDNQRDYSKLISMFGIFYEIRDDYCNLMKQEDLEGKSHRAEFNKLDEKSFCEDITDGKFSFPVLHALRTTPESAPILHALKDRTRDIEVKKYCVSLLQELGSLQYTLDVIHRMDKEMREEITRLGGNPKFEALLDDFYVE